MALKSIEGYHSMCKSRTIFKGSGPRFIGMEIEKSKHLDGYDHNRFEEVPLIQRYERDGSCGYEYITYAYELSDRGFEQFHEDVNKSKTFLNLPINTKCGGHITVSKKQTTNQQMFNMMVETKALSFIFSLYRARLNNQYCGFNPTMTTGHYALRKREHTSLEFRLVPAFKDEKQVLFRYQLFNLAVKAKFRLKKAINLCEKEINSRSMELTLKFQKDFQKVLEGKEPSERLRNYLKFYKQTF